MRETFNKTTSSDVFFFVCKYSFRSTVGIFLFVRGAFLEQKHVLDCKNQNKTSNKTTKKPEISYSC